jgi:hypothetical protein
VRNTAGIRHACARLLVDAIAKVFDYAARTTLFICIIPHAMVRPRRLALTVSLPARCNMTSFGVAHGPSLPVSFTPAQVSRSIIPLGNGWAHR